MFGFLKKQKKSEEEKYAESLPMMKKVQFDSMPIDEAEAKLNSDLNSILEFAPANYYAMKDDYLLCVFYYKEDFSEIFMQLEYCVDDVSKSRTRIFSIDKELMRGILRKFGQNI